jgi:hypothetical protein
MPSIINATTTNGVAVSGDNSGSLALQTNNGTTAVTITTGQQVGIGTTSPTANTQVDIVSADASQQFVDVLKLKTSTNGDYHPSILFENNRNGIANAAKIVMDSATTAGSGFLGIRIKQSAGSFTTVAGFNNDGQFQFNSGYGSSANAYGCRAWVNFNGTGTVAIRASGNVSSITDVNTGNYRINFTNNMPDGNYSVVATTTVDRFASSQADSNPTNYADIRSTNTSATYTDVAALCVAIFR